MTRSYIRFDDPDAYPFLMKNRRIYTLRWFHKHTGSGIPVLHKGKRVGDCSIRLVRKVHSVAELVEFVELSGFPTCEKWWGRARTYYPAKSTFFLYDVRLLPTRLERSLNGGNVNGTAA